MLLETLMKKIFGDPNAKELKICQGYVEQINALEPEMVKLSDASLNAKTSEFKLRLSKGETLDDILVEAFAVVREAGIRRKPCFRPHWIGYRARHGRLCGGCSLRQHAMHFDSAARCSRALALSFV